MEDTLSRHANMLYVTASSIYETNLEDKIEMKQSLINITKK